MKMKIKFIQPKLLYLFENNKTNIFHYSPFFFNPSSAKIYF